MPGLSRLTSVVVGLSLGCFALASVPLGCAEEEVGTGWLGSEAHNFLSSETYTHVVAEVDYVEGKAPATGAFEYMKTVINDVIAKDGATALLDSELAAQGEAHAYSLSEIREIEDANRSNYRSGDTVAVYFLFLDGRYAGDSDTSYTLGLAYSGSSVVIFKDNVEKHCLPLQATYAAEGKSVLADKICSLMEGTTWVHELGHLLGLVNTGAPLASEHQDHDHGKHCDNDECIMYWSNNTSAIVELIKARINAGNEDFVPFDEACRDDLRALEASQ